MATVGLTIAGRRYDIGCERGAEARLQSLGEVIDAKARRIAAAKGRPGETRILLLAALELADELTHALARATAAESAATQLGTDLVNLETQAAEILKDAARQIDQIGADWE
jgi:cell division protein ZapA